MFVGVQRVCALTNPLICYDLIIRFDAITLKGAVFYNRKTDEKDILEKRGLYEKQELGIIAG
jgi:hypothetical protein